MNEDRTLQTNRHPIVFGITCVVLTLVVLQLWLLSATMNSYLGGDKSVLWPAALASLVCLFINLWLLSHFSVLKR